MNMNYPQQNHVVPQPKELMARKSSAIRFTVKNHQWEDPSRSILFLLATNITLWYNVGYISNEIAI